MKCADDRHLFNKLIGYNILQCLCGKETMTLRACPHCHGSGQVIDAKSE